MVQNAESDHFLLSYTISILQSGSWLLTCTIWSDFYRFVRLSLFLHQGSEVDIFVK